MNLLLLLPMLAPLFAAVLAIIFGWRKLTSWTTVVAAFAILLSGVILGFNRGLGVRFSILDLFRADSLTITMLIVIGTVGALATWASVGYIDAELTSGHTNTKGANLYGVLVPLFLATMASAVLANNIGVMWVAIEATTVCTAFLVGHHRTRAALEATWKYVVICSVGIALAFLGTVLLYFASLHAGATSADALNIDVLIAHANRLDPAVTRLAAGLLLLGYGTKAGLVPFHTWLADAHSQAPAPVSALMSGVLLSVAFYALLRVKSVVDLAVGIQFMRTGLIIVGLLTLLIAASLLLVQTDFKRMLAYSSMENMGLVAVAAAVGTKLAIAALLLHVLAHGIAKTLVFLGSGELQDAHHSTRIRDVTGVLNRSPLVGITFMVGLATLLGLPPFAMFASELSISRSMADAGLGWVLGAALLFVVVAFAALVRNGSAMMLGTPGAGSPAIVVPRAVGTALVVGVILSLVLGLTIGPLLNLFQTAATQLGGIR
jgi:hydrogenase-4 component F